MTTTITKTVRTTGGDYTSLSAFEAGEQRDLTAVDEISRALCGNLADSGNVDFLGWTTDATRYILLEAEQNHGGKWSTAAYRLAGPGALTITEDYVRLLGLQLEQSGAGGSGWALQVALAADVRIDRTIIRSTYTGNFDSRGLYLNANNSTTAIRNCVIYDFVNAASGNGTGIDAGGGAGANRNVYAYNCTVVGCSTGVQGGSHGGVRVKNVLYKSQGVTAADGFLASGGFHSASDYNASDLASDAPGANSRNSQTFTFIDEAADDFHLSDADGGARNFGLDLSGDANYPFTEDVDGEVRSAPWDIGADETPGIAPPLFIPRSYANAAEWR